MPHAKPAEILFGNYRRQVLGLLFLRPDESFHVREISRLTKIPAGSLHRELKLLAEAELLVRQEVGRQVYYRAKRENPIFEDLAAIFRKTAGLADVIREALLPLADELDLAFVFGSTARGEERSGSDIDLMVLGSVSFVAVVGALAAIHERLGREVNPVVMARGDFGRTWRADPFLQRVMKEPKIFVMGTADDLAKLAADGTTEKA
ncbi:MAG: nucleotidyltransferase domain-containing protein [Deltaproteobacteria bacterium]|nr:nucleotidyltransferase domain-containing protein [Deltaproteobacteria bacterium]